MPERKTPRDKLQASRIAVRDLFLKVKDGQAVSLEVFQSVALTALLCVVTYVLTKNGELNEE